MVEYWRTVDTFDDNGTTMALQQKHSAKPGGKAIPRDEHRVVPVGKLV